MAVPLVTQNVWPIGEHQTPHGQPGQFGCWAPGNVEMLILRRGCDCDLRRRRWNEMRRSKPGQNGDTNYRRHYLNTCQRVIPQHVRFCWALRCDQKLSPGKLTATEPLFVVS